MLDVELEVVRVGILEGKGGVFEAFQDGRKKSRQIDVQCVIAAFFHHFPPSI